MENTPSSRDKILDTGEALFSRHGFSGVGMREVAERVGLSKSALFHHFPTKLSIYVAVLDRILGQIDGRLERECVAGPSNTSARDQIRAWASAVIDVLAENPTHAPLLLRTLFEGEVLPVDEQAQLDETLGRTLGRVARVLQEGIASGELRDVSVPHTIQTLIGATVYHFASGEFGDELLRAPIFSAAEVRRRKDHVFQLIEHAFVA